MLTARRFEERNNELETQFIQLREDKADVVAFLKRTLQQRTDTIHVRSEPPACDPSSASKSCIRIASEGS